MRQKPQAYAITINTHASHRLFQRTANAELMVATLFRYRDEGRFLLHGYVVMPDHIHVLLTPTESTARAVQLIKGGFSFAIREQFKGEVWHTGHHEHRIRNGADYTAQLAYIAANPLRTNYTDYPYVHPTIQKRWTLLHPSARDHDGATISNMVSVDFGPEREAELAAEAKVRGMSTEAYVIELIHAYLARTSSSEAIPTDAT